MKSALPKVLHQIANRPMVGHVQAAVSALGTDRSVVVVGPGMENVAAAVAPAEIAVQERQAGTADAVKAALPKLAGFNEGTVVILFGDTPFIEVETLERMVQARDAGAAVVVLGFEPDDPTGYGRLVQDGEGALQAIVEHKDATHKQREIGVCNSGVMALDARLALPLLDEIGNDNASGEYYLTDIVGIARDKGYHCAVTMAAEAEVLGVNSRVDLARAETIWQDKRRLQAMVDGATLRDPATVWFSYDTVLGRDVIIEQSVFFGPGVVIADNVTIHAFSHLQGAKVDNGAIVGPYARLREGTHLHAGAKVGNFVETKKTVVGEGAKVNHLTYLGDADIGARSNIGAGTITCNYDGFNKSPTIVGEGAFIGSNSALVAPVKIGAGAIVGAGSVITGNVEDDALAIARGIQVEKAGAAPAFREKAKAIKNAKVNENKG